MADDMQNPLLDETQEQTIEKMVEAGLDVAASLFKDVSENSEHTRVFNKALALSKAVIRANARIRRERKSKRP